MVGLVWLSDSSPADNNQQPCFHLCVVSKMPRYRHNGPPGQVGRSSDLPVTGSDSFRGHFSFTGPPWGAGLSVNWTVKCTCAHTRKHTHTHTQFFHMQIGTFMSCRQWLMRREDDQLTPTVRLDTHTHTHNTKVLHLYKMRPEAKLQKQTESWTMRI